MNHGFSVPYLPPLHSINNQLFVMAGITLRTSSPQMNPRRTPRANSLLQAAWPDDDVDMGSDMGPSQLEAALSARGGLLPPLAPALGEFTRPQQTFAALVVRRFKVSILLNLDES